ncbi:hypothetical protein Vadar_024665 [Vaccinium darrowii]|uniref:Uncharacterized protein n=1 Tax=Vaccinium darrowii TaxID=229202 RepID=A0ACB7Y9G1_9ERIC|nr:hypothetical protein Vadar_024665 [Vaccinium darrowii]
MIIGGKSLSVLLVLDRGNECKTLVVLHTTELESWVIFRRALDEVERYHRFDTYSVSEMASKNIVADLSKGEKLNGDNFDIWHRKIQYVLHEQEVEDLLTHSMTEPEKGDTIQHTLDLAAYEKWRKRDRCARSIMLSSMSNDLLDEFDEYPTAKAMWKTLKAKYGGTSTTRLRGLTIRFDSPWRTTRWKRN